MYCGSIKINTNNSFYNALFLHGKMLTNILKIKIREPIMGKKCLLKKKFNEEIITF
jgi:hypothetical protein